MSDVFLISVIGVCVGILLILVGVIIGESTREDVDDER